MKKNIALLMGLLCLTIAAYTQAEPNTVPKEKYYGKITAINPDQRSLTVHNSRQQTDSQFQWDENTSVRYQKKSISPTELKVGQSLYVSYFMDKELKKAAYISVRTPFKKSQE